MGENNLIPDAAVEAIQDSVRTEIISVDGTNFLSRQVYAPPANDLPKPVGLNTLTGLVDYLNDGSDLLKVDKGVMVHIVNEVRVDLVSALFGRFEQRKLYASAAAEAVLSSKSPVSVFSFGHFYDSEDFIIKLLSLFEDNYQRADVLKVVGNIKEESIRQTEDDGITQTVSARAGIARVADVIVPNPVTLAPYRTFRELWQPASPFVLRLKPAQGQMPNAALFEADGGQWKLDAIASIKEFLVEHITDVPVIA